MLSTFKLEILDAQKWKHSVLLQTPNWSGTVLINPGIYTMYTLRATHDSYEKKKLVVPCENENVNYV